MEEFSQKGIITFSTEKVYQLFPTKGKRGITNASLSLVNKGKIQSAWKGCYYPPLNTHIQRCSTSRCLHKPVNGILDYNSKGEN